MSSGTLQLGPNVNTVGGIPGTVTNITANNPLSVTNPTTTPVISISQSNSTTDGYLSSTDWITFNNKLDASQGNYITNPSAEFDVLGWNLYNNSGRTTSAFIVAQDITWTSVASGNSGNGINIQYKFHATQSYLTPLVTVVSPTLITVAWYNGPTVSNNPTATQLLSAFNAVPGAVALATGVITGTSGKLQYITGSNVLTQGGDTAPVDGTGGVVVGETITRNTSTPLVGVASFDLGKDAANRQGEGISTDFIIDSAFKNQSLQVSFFYSGSVDLTLGTSSDVKVFIYDITNSTMLPITSYLKGPTTNTTYRFAAQFTATTSVSYRLIIHTSTTNALAWDLLFDEVTVSSVLDAATVTNTRSLVLNTQPINASVNNTLGPMVVMWTDGATSWVPAVNTNTDESTMFGFATNIIGLTADITVRGYLSGFSFGPFLGYNQYIDNTPGLISPLPSPFTDTYITVGKAIDAFTLNVQFQQFYSFVNHGKGSLLTSNGANNGNGDTVLSVGANGNALIANSGAANGINWAPAVVAGTGVTYTLATRTLTVNNLAGNVTGAPNATVIAAATVTGKLITGYVSGSGTVAATDTILQAINKLNGNTLLKANTASPVFTGDADSSTGNVLISTIGKGLQVKTGTNAKIGTVTLVAGTATVANTSVTANSRIFVCSNTDGGTPGFLRVSAKVVGTSFTITSSSALDTSTVAYNIIESIP